MTRAPSPEDSERDGDAADPRQSLELHVAELQSRLERARAAPSGSGWGAVAFSGIGVVAFIAGLLTLAGGAIPSFWAIPLLATAAVGVLQLTTYLWTRWRWGTRVTDLEEALKELRRQLRELDRSIFVESVSVAEPGEMLTPVTTMLEPPDELVAACVEQQCVLYAGTGIAAQAGFPTYRDMLARVIDAADSRGLWTQPVEGASLDARQFTEATRRALAGGDFAAVAELIDARLDRTALQKILLQIYGGGASVSRPAICDALGAIPFAGVVTADWSGLLERTFDERLAQPGSLSVSIRSAPNFADRFRQGLFTLIRIFGGLERADEVVFTTEEFRRAVQENAELAKFQASLLASRTFLFVGTSLESIEQFLSAFGTGRSQRHFALVAWQADIDIQQERFRTRWGLELLRFVPDREYSAVEEFCAALSRRVIRASAGLVLGRPTPQARAGKLDKVVLSNIGPFRDLTLEFDARWNVVLGDNGSGKSTLLKAIALGLCGDDPRAASLATPLLRYGEDVTAGSIELTAGNETYRTELVRRDGQVRVSSRTLTRLQHGDWPVVGFPAVRGASSSEAHSPSSDAPSPQPIVEDLLPILAGAVDTRVDAIKQWIVNVYFRPDGSKDGRVPTAQNLALIRSFFRLVAYFTPGLKLEFVTITPDYHVLVDTNHGVVPIELISQGMSSIVGWVGTLLQRMFAIYPNSAKPEAEAALVLIDELDAHMHPSWEYQLVATLRIHFPNVQFIATTHSPLIAGNMAPRNIVLLHDGQVARWESGYDPRTMGVAGLLTSEAFRLRSELPMAIQSKLDRRNELYLKAARTSIEAEEMRKLSDELADAGFVREFRDPVYQRFALAFSERASIPRPSLGPDDIKRQAAIANEIVNEILAEEKT